MSIIGYSEMLQEDASDLAGAERFVDDLRKIHAAPSLLARSSTTHVHRRPRRSR